jgi:hypothetical protein
LQHRKVAAYLCFPDERKTTPVDSPNRCAKSFDDGHTPKKGREEYRLYENGNEDHYCSDCGEMLTSGEFFWMKYSYLKISGNFMLVPTIGVIR